MTEEERKRKSLNQFLIQAGRSYQPAAKPSAPQPTVNDYVRGMQQQSRANPALRAQNSARIKALLTSQNVNDAQFKGFALPTVAEVAKAAPKIVLGNTARLANTGAAQVYQLGATTRIAAAAKTNNAEAYRNAQARLDAAENRFKNNGGLFNAGTFYNKEEAKRGDFKTGITKIGGGTVGVATEILPVARGGSFVLKGVSPIKAVPRLAIENTAYGLTGSGAEQLRTEGKISAKRLGVDTLLANTLGLGTYGIGRKFSNNQLFNRLSRSNDVQETATLLSRRFENASDDEIGRLTANVLEETDKGKIKGIIRDFEKGKVTDLPTPETPTRSFDGAKAPETTIHLPKQNVYARVTPEQATILRNEIANVKSSADDLVHLSAPTGQLTKKAKEVSLDEIASRSNNAKQTLQNADATIKESIDQATPPPKPPTAAQAIEEAPPVTLATPESQAAIAADQAAVNPTRVEASSVDNAVAEVPGAVPASRNTVVDATAQASLKAGKTDEAIAVYMSQGMNYGEAQAAVRKLAQESGISLDNMGKAFVEGEPTVPTGRAMKDPGVADIMQGLSSGRALSSTDARLTSATIERAAAKYGVNTSDPEFILRYQTGQLTDPNEIAFAQVVKPETDRLFALQQQIDPTIKYRTNYLPQSYAQDTTQVDDAVRQLQTRTGASNSRSFNTYQEAAAYGLTPKNKNIEQMIGEGVGSAQQALANKNVIDNGLEQGLFSSRQVDRNWKPVEGFFNQGSPVYASPKVANTINNALQESTDALSKTVRGLGKVNATWQDVMLSGGIPYTPANFFVFGQMIKELTAGRVSAVKDLIYSLSDKLTQTRFADNADFVREMAQRGLFFNIKSHLDDVDESWLANKWGKAMNKAIFERFMPNQYLSVAENIYKKTGDYDLAADTVKKYYGVVDQIAKGRSTSVQNGINAALFAPRYRESIINTLINTGKSISPTTWGDSAYNMNRRLAAGMAVTLVGAEILQRKISGHGLLDNRTGQEGSIEIAVGGKDEKGNQKVINIPLMPGFLTLPRAAWEAVSSAIDGNAPGVVKAGSKVLATPLQVGGQVIGNSDYFGRPIYNDQATADQEGIDADSNATKAGKIAKYIGFQGMPGYGRAVRDAVNGKSGLEVAAQAGELPIRFGKKLNPATDAYFKDREAVYGKLDKNDKAVWDTLHPKLKNVNGEYITDPTVWSGAARAVNYLNSPKVLEAENDMARRAKARGQKVDPLWELDGNKQLIALTIATLPPKDPQRDKLKKDNPWYQTLSNDRSKFFDSLPPSDPNKPKGPIDYPEPSPKVSALQDAYYQLDDSSLKRDFLKKNPDVAEQFAKDEQYSRAVRAAKLLPQYDKYPEPSPAVQKLNDFYSSLPKQEGHVKKDGTKASDTRSAWINSHPDEWAQLTDYWSKVAQFNLQNEAEMANFEGEDMSEKGIKAISSLAKSLGDSGSSYFGFGKRGDPTYDKLFISQLLEGGGINFKVPTVPNSKVRKTKLKIVVPKTTGRRKVLRLN